MSKFDAAAFSNGDIMRRLRELERKVDQNAAARSLERATIGQGGLRVKGEGGVRIEDGGELIVTGPGESVEVRDGVVYFRRGDFPNAGRIFAFQSSDGRLATLIAPPWTVSGPLNHISIEGASDLSPGALFFITEGQLSADVGGNIFQFAGQQIQLKADESIFLITPLTLDFRATGNIFLDGEANIFIDAAQQVQIKSAAQQVFIDHATTTNTANCEIATNGLIRRSTSARKYKQDIGDLDVDPDAVLRLRPRTWRDRADVEADPTTTRRNVGYVAEEVLEAGCGQFVSTDANGQPEAVSYDRITCALLAVIQRQEQRIADLERRAGITPPAPTGRPVTAPQPPGHQPAPDDVDHDTPVARPRTTPPPAPSRSLPT